MQMYMRGLRDSEVSFRTWSQASILLCVFYNCLHEPTAGLRHWPVLVSKHVSHASSFSTSQLILNVKGTS